MPPDEYSAAPSSGKLKLKGIIDGKVDKKKKKKRPKLVPDNEQEDDFVDKSVVLKTLEDEDEKIQKDSRRKLGVVDGKDVEPGAGAADEDVRDHLKTESERRFDEQRKKRLEERLKREGVKSHKQRVEELNHYLSSLSDHHDMPRIGPG